MKKFKLFIILFLCLSLCSCKSKNPVEDPKVVDDPTFIDEPEVKTYKVSFVEEGAVIKVVEVKEGENVEFPEFDTPIGYYYTPLYYESEAENIRQDKELEIVLKEYYKDEEFYIDDKLIRTSTEKYHVIVKAPTFDDALMESYEWIQDEMIFTGTQYIQRYHLSYVPVKEFKITYYDGEEELNLEPSTYDNTVTTELPKPEKEGYEFIGWFLSDISLTCYNEIEEGTKGHITFYAKYVETETHNPMVLPEADLHFTQAVQQNDNPTMKVWRPLIPSTARSQSVTDYDWESSDINVVRITAFASVAVVSSGYTIITATLKDDPTYKINGIFKATIDGISIATAEEANTIDLATVTFVGKDGETIGTQKVRKGGFAYLPTPPSYEGYAFAGWDRDNWNITNDVTFQALYTQEYENPYVGKTVAFIGDSLTSYHSYIPHGFDSFLPYPTSDTFDVNQTWWMQITNKLGAKMFVNNSYGGTCVIAGTEPTKTESRLSHLKIGHQTPDVVFIYMGSNDCAACESYPREYSANNFATAYQMMIENVQKLCPESEIVLVTLAVSKMYQKQTQNVFNQVIKSLANKYNLKVVDLSGLDNTQPLNGVPLIVDNGHPSKAGNDEIAKYFYTQLLK